MDRLRNVLVGTDLSVDSLSAVRQGARVAALCHADLHVLHVVRDEAAFELKQVMGAASPAVDEDLTRDAESQVRALLEEEEIETAVSVRVVRGNPIQQIVATIEEVKADLLVVGASGASGKRTFGSTAVRCVRKAPTKVLVVPAGSDGPFSKTLACVDFSALSPMVMMQAARVGHLDGSEVTAIHCYQMPWDQARWGPSPGNDLELEEDFRRVLQGRFEHELLPHAHGHPVQLHARPHGNFGDGIVEYAKFTGSDLVVLGTSGRTALAYMLLGTTAEKVMRSVGCAVLAVKVPGEGLGLPEAGETGER